MANVKITELTQMTTVANIDVMPIVAVTANVTQKVTGATLRQFFNADVMGGNLTTNLLGNGFGAQNLTNVSVLNTVSAADFLSSGTVQANGNVSGANFVTTGRVTATGNVTGGNVVTGGRVDATGNVSGGNLTTAGRVDATGNVAGSNLTTSGQVSATGNITGANFNTAGLVAATGNVSGGNVAATGLVSAATGNITGNLAAGNINTPGQVVATGNITAPYFIGNIVGNIDAGGANTTIQFNDDELLTGSTAFTFDKSTNAVVATGNVTAGNVNTGGRVTATGNVSGGNLTTAGVVAAGTATITGTAGVGNLNSAGTITANGNITGANINTAGLLSAGSADVTGNIDGGNINATGQVVAVGNITGDYFIGNGALLTGIDTTLIRNGNSNVQVYANGNVAVSVTGQANVGVFTASGAEIDGTLSATGNASAQNYLTAGEVYAANVRASSLVSNTTLSLTSGTDSNINIQPNGAGNIVLSNTYINSVRYPVQNQDAASKEYVDTMTSTAINFHEAVFAATNTTLAVATGGTITYNNGANGVGATLTTTGAFTFIDTANVQTANTRILVKDEANLAFNGVYVYSNATVITRSTDTDTYAPADPDALSINDYFFVQSGNVNAGSAWVCDGPIGPITFGVSNIRFAQFSSSQTYSANVDAGLSLSGTTFSAKVDNNTTAFNGNGNIVVKAGANLTTPNIDSATGTSLQLTANVTAGNVVTGGDIDANGTITGGTVSATGNVSGGNITTAGNATAAFFIGDGSQLSNITAANITGAYSNANVANYLPTYTGNLESLTGNVTTTANVQANYFIGNGSQLTGIQQSQLTNGNSNVTVINNGNITMAVAGVDNVVVVGSAETTVAGNVMPSASNTYTLGSNTARWKDLYLSNSTLYLGETAVSANANGLLVNNEIVVTADANNLLDVNEIVVAGNVTTESFFIGDGSFLSNITAGNIVGGYSNADVANYLPTYAGNLVSLTGDVVTTANIQANYFIGNGSQLTGLPDNYTDANVTALLANLDANVINSAANITTTANIQANYFIGDGSQLTNLPVGDYSNANVANYLPTYTGNLVSLTGDVVTTANIQANYFIGNGSQLTGLPASYSDANVTALLANLDANVINSAANITTTGNIQGNYILGDGSQLTNLPLGNYSNANVANYLPTYTGNLASLTGNVTTTANVNANNIQVSSNVLVANLNANLLQGRNVTSARTPNFIVTRDASGSFAANAIVANTLTANQNLISEGNANITGNITANFYFGNGSQLTGITANYSNANVANYLPTYTGNLVSLTGNITTTANVQANYFIGDGSALTNLPLGNYSNANVANYLPTYTGNLASLTGNVTTTANIQANYFIGNGSQLTGIVADYSNANVANYLPTYTGNLVSLTGNVTTTANLSAGNITTRLLTANNGVSITAGILNMNNRAIANADQISISDPGRGEGLNFNGGNIWSIFESPNDFTNTGGNLQFTSGNTANAANTLAYTRVTFNTLGQVDIPVVTGTAPLVVASNTQVANLNASLLEGYVTNVGAVANTIALRDGNGNLTANFYIGDGSQLTNLPTGNYSNANVANYLPTYTGNLVSLTGDVVTTGNVNANIVTANSITTSGGNGNITGVNYITANFFVGDGSLLSNISSANIVGGYSNANVANYLPTYTGNLVSLTGNIITTANLSANNITTRLITANGGMNITGGALDMGGRSITNVNALTIADPGRNEGFIISGGNTWAIFESPNDFTNTGGNLQFTSGNNANAANTLAYTRVTFNTLGQVEIPETDYAPLVVGSNIVVANLNASLLQGSVPNVSAIANTVVLRDSNGNVTANFFIGDGSQLTNIAGGNYSNANVANYLPTYSGNIGVLGDLFVIAIGKDSGLVSQGNRAIAIGYSAANNDQGTDAIAIGQLAGSNTQASQSVAIGIYAAQTNQGSRSIALGAFAGRADQGAQAVAIGNSAGNTTQGNNAIAIGSLAAFVTQGANSIAIGRAAGRDTQGIYAVAVGSDAGDTNQGANAVAIGSEAGQINQGNSSIAMGYQAGESNQGTESVALGYQSGSNAQGIQSVALGFQCGQTTQGNRAVAIGYQAGLNDQEDNSVAIGYQSGEFRQLGNSVAMGYEAGYTDQAGNATAIGSSAGYQNQGGAAVAVGTLAGYNGQGSNSVALGSGSGYNTQAANAIALGTLAGYESQGANSIALGLGAGLDTLQSEAIAIGTLAGNLMGNYSIAIGSYAGNALPDNSIVLNATGDDLTANASNVFIVKPIRNGGNTGSLPSGFVNMGYNPTTGEIIYWT